ncbi:YcnI family protein [Microlunatus sp. GCM10028923]|uniref:YcnI family copper-binding membrane protein n=1 Tax=Microlunatus sp. GCM10028923 TaxID=3273400 RepID=UPI003613C0C9
MQRLVPATVIGGILLLLLGATPASAHVSVSTARAVAGEYAVLTFAVPHGCEGSPTTKIAIKIPEVITTTKPTVVADWKAEVVRVKLAEPKTDSHGTTITERVDQVVYTAEQPLPDELRQTFQVQVKLPDDAAGTTLAFPTVQTCAKGETAWIQVPAAGQDPETLELPAPSVAVTGPESSAAPAVPAAESSLGWTGPAGLVAGLLGLAAGGYALIRTRRRS